MLLHAGHVCVAMFDRDRSGSIELHEFQSLWTYIGQWRQIFDQYDRDRSGAIDGSELHNSKPTLCIIQCRSYFELLESLCFFLKAFILSKILSIKDHGQKPGFILGKMIGSFRSIHFVIVTAYCTVANSISLNTYVNVSQDIDGEEHLENDLFCVEWYLKP